MDSLLQQTVSNTSSHCTLLQCPPEKSKREEEEEEEPAEEEEVAAEMFEELLKLRCGRHNMETQISLEEETLLLLLQCNVDHKYLDSRRELSKQISKNNLQATNIRTK
jgi:hypothetical protein